MQCEGDVWLDFKKKKKKVEEDLLGEAVPWLGQVVYPNYLVVTRPPRKGRAGRGGANVLILATRR